MPGFLLAKKAAEVFEEDETVEGLVLLKHGIFTFGDTARDAYERMIDAVSRAEERLRRRDGKHASLPPDCPPAIAAPGEIAPILRGACALPEREGAFRRFVMDFRGGPAARNLASGADVGRYGRAGVATPDHTIRTKNYPLIVPAPEAAKLTDFAAAAHQAVEAFVAEYHAYFARHNKGDKRRLDPAPRVVLSAGAGAVRIGAQRQGHRGRRRPRRKLR